MFTHNINKFSSLRGSFINKDTGEEVEFTEVDHFGADHSVGLDEYWEVHGNDGQSYYIYENGQVQNVANEVVGSFDPYSNPDEDNALDTERDFYPDWQGPEHDAKVAAEEGFSFQGASGGTDGVATGVAVRPDMQSQEEILSIADNLATHDDDKANQKRLIPDWAVNKGGKTADFEPANENSTGTGGQGVTYAPGVIVVAKWVTPDQNWILEHDRCIGIIAEAGGLTSHGVVVARQRNIPIIVDAMEAARIKPGDQVTMQSGIVKVNGGGDDVIDHNAPGVVASMGVTRFVFAQGQGVTAPIDPNDPDGGTLHTQLAMELMESVDYELEDLALGTIYDDGHADVVGTPPDKDQLIAFLQQNGAQDDIRWHGGDLAAFLGSRTAASKGKYPVGTRIQFEHNKLKGQRGSITGYSGEDANFDEEKYDILLDNGEKLEGVSEATFKKIKSASVRDLDTTAAYFLDDDEFENHEVVRYSGLPDEHPYNHLDYDGMSNKFIDENDWDHLKPTIERLPEKAEIVGLALGALSHFSTTGDITQAVEQAQTGLNQGVVYRILTGVLRAAGNDVGEAERLLREIDSPPHQATGGWKLGYGEVVAPSQTTTGVANCPNCGEPGTPTQRVNTVQHYRCPRDGTEFNEGGIPVAAPGTVPGVQQPVAHIAADSNGNDLSVGEWYVMHSTQYKVPDVIQIIHLDDNRIEASIEGDNKTVFPIAITQKELEKMGYSFEPYDEHHEPRESMWRLARKSFSPTQQREFVNEATGSKARNIDKLNLDGTHYPSTSEDDPEFLWF